jgi:hypothetical protein
VVVGLVALLQSNSGSNWDTVHPLLDVAAFGLGESLGAIGAAGGGELGSLSLGGERLTYKIGFERGEAAAEAGMELILGKYPANVNYVALTPGPLHWTSLTGGLQCTMPGSFVDSWKAGARLDSCPGMFREPTRLRSSRY